MAPIPRRPVLARIDAAGGQTAMELCFPGHPARWVTVPVAQPGRSARETRAAAEAQLAGMGEDELERLYDRARPGPPFTREIDLGVVSDMRRRAVAASYVGVLHCAACSAPIARGVVPLPFAAECEGCGRHVTAKRAGRRLVLEVDVE